MSKIKFLKPDVRSDGTTIIKVDYVDPYTESDPTTYESVQREIVNVLIPRLEEYKKAKGSEYRKRGANPITDGFFAQSEVVRKWQKTMPTAAALYPLQKPGNKTLSDGTPFDSVAERYFPHALDGVGLRSRAAIMQKIMEEHFIKYTPESGSPIKWASLACGAAVPVFDAAKELVGHGKDIDIYLADLDKKALVFAKQLAEKEYGLHKSIKIDRRNILKINKLTNDLGEENFDAIDILGFFEYLPSKSWVYRKYKVKKKMPGATEFLRAAYSLLKPGGLLVLGNMRDTHSQLVFTTEIVQWPHIRPRSLDRVTEIISEAGINKNNIIYYQAGDGVYTVAAIGK